MNRFKKFHSALSSRSQNVLRMILAFLILAFGVVVAMNVAVRTATAGPGDPFGGFSYMVEECTCTDNYAIYFNDLTITSTTGGLPLIYQPGSTILYQFNMITTPMVWILGTWQRGGTCEVYAGKSCDEITTAGTMYMVGTSMAS